MDTEKPPYYDGDLVTIGFPLTNPITDPTTGDPVDPTTLTLSLSVLSLDGTTRSPTVPSVTKLGVGSYQAEVDTTGFPGRWTHQWVGLNSSGAGMLTAVGTFKVLARPIPSS